VQALFLGFRIITKLLTMTKEKWHRVCNIIAIICGVWFLLLGWFWVWYINIFLAYPVGIIGFFLWLAGRKAERKKLNKIAGYLLLIGLVISISVFFIVI